MRCAPVCVCVWNVDGRYKSTISGGDKSRRVVGAWQRVCCWRCATGAARPLPIMPLPVVVAQCGSSTPTLPPILGAVAEAAAVSAITIKSQLAHSPPPPPDLFSRSTGPPAGSMISQYRDMNSYDNRYGYFATI